MSFLKYYLKQGTPSQEGFFDRFKQKPYLDLPKMLVYIENAKGLSKKELIDNTESKYGKTITKIKSEDIIKDITEKTNTLSNVNIKKHTEVLCNSIENFIKSWINHTDHEKRLVAVDQAKHALRSNFKPLLQLVKTPLIGQYIVEIHEDEPISFTGKEVEVDIPEKVQPPADLNEVKQLVKLVRKTLTDFEKNVIPAGTLITQFNRKVNGGAAGEAYDRFKELVLDTDQYRDFIFILLDKIKSLYEKAMNYFYQNVEETVSNEGLMDLFSKPKHQLSLQEMIHRLKTVKECPPSHLMKNGYGEALGSHIQMKDIVHHLLVRTERLEKVSFINIANAVSKTIMKLARELRENNEGDLSVYEEASYEIYEAVSKYIKNSTSEQFIGNLSVTVSRSRSDGTKLVFENLEGKGSADQVYSLDSVSDLNKIVSAIEKLLKSKSNEAEAVGKIMYKLVDTLQAYDESIYDEILDFVFNPRVFADDFNIFIEDIKEEYTHALTYLMDSMALPTLEAFSLEAEENQNEENNENDQEQSDTGAEENDASPDADTGSSDRNAPDDEDTADQSADTGTDGEGSSGDATENVTESDETSSNETAKETKAEKPVRPEVILDNPDKDKDDCAAYLSALLGDGVKDLTLYTAKEVNRPLYHMSMNPDIKLFSPKVSARTLSKEDRSVPRISTSTSLIGCMNGYQSMFTDIANRAKKNFTGLYTIYELPYQLAVKPSKKLLPDAELSDEYWIVSWKKETYATRPNVIGEFNIPQINITYGNDGEDKTVTVFLKVREGEFYLSHDVKVPQGYYEVTLKGYNFKYPLKNNNRITVKEITEREYIKVTSLSVMIKQKEK